MNGFGFIEYKDAMDARDVVPGKSYSHPCTDLEVTQSTDCMCAAFRRFTSAAQLSYAY